MITPNDYRQALAVQDACNLSGVVHAWSRVLTRIWAWAHATGHGTDDVNTHPISVLYAAKVADLSGAGPIDADAYATAYRAATIGAANVDAASVGGVVH